MNSGALKILRVAGAEASVRNEAASCPLTQNVPAAAQMSQAAFTDKLVHCRISAIRLLTMLGRHQLGIIALHGDPVLVMLAHNPAVRSGRQLPSVIKRFPVQGQAISSSHSRLPVVAIGSTRTRVV